MKKIIKTLFLIFIFQNLSVLAQDSVFLQPDEVYFFDLTETPSEIAEAANTHSRISDAKKDEGIVYFDKKSLSTAEKTEKAVNNFIKKRVHNNKLNFYFSEIE